IDGTRQLKKQAIPLAVLPVFLQNGLFVSFYVGLSHFCDKLVRETKTVSFLWYQTKREVRR
ncbi:MAG TPA: hypothetical protein H9896_08195, partial [Candidatus Pygmaiobacter gallistercoris]|nr:hypothetical protein [Candidatus Pygmaiobacter gallistercoris]